ncbi:MAG: GtrA family protein [Lachnospiraceae bacterium]|nr:GtrA family protein [Lachnospiraceae bacterium]MDE7272139.1 GtrA family protein [Lachnospiraceae bacterium]
MKKLFAQIIKFGFVGGVCFLIDFAISTVLFHLLRGMLGQEAVSAATAIGGFVGFTISVVVNYILSMRYVFERKENLSKRKEFLIFVILSIIGLGINEVILLGCRRAYEGSAFLMETFYDDTWWFALSKVIATAVVMVYNFVSRKIILEKHE